MDKKKYVENSKDLAFKLRRCRQEKGIIQKDMAKLLNVERSTYTYYELAKTTPSIFTLIEISKVLNIDLNEIISINK